MVYGLGSGESAVREISPGVRRKGKEREVHRDLVLLCAEQKCFKVGRNARSHHCVGLDESSIRHPPPVRTKSRHDATSHQNPSPKPCVASQEIPSIFFGCEVVGSNGKNGAPSRVRKSPFTPRTGRNPEPSSPQPKTIFDRTRGIAAISQSRGDRIKRAAKFYEGHIDVRDSISGRNRERRRVHHLIRRPQCQFHLAGARAADSAVLLRIPQMDSDLRRLILLNGENSNSIEK